MQYHAVASEHSFLCLLLSLRFRGVASFVQAGISNREETPSECYALPIIGLNFNIPSDFVFPSFPLLYSSGAHQKPPSLLRAPALVHPAGSSV